jgi:nucleoside-diphosphate-sugar epimerase
VAIAGLGFLGRALADALAAELAPAELPIRAVTRTCPEAPVPEAIRLHALDLRTAAPADIAAALGPARSLVICLAAGRTQDPRDLYLGATARLLAAAGDRLARVVYTSSTSALPDRDAWLDDDCPDPPEHARGQIQRAAEDLVRTACEARDIPWTILRLAGLYGPGRPLFRIYRYDPGATQPGDGMQATNLVHRDDAVAACIAALALPPDIRAVVNVCDDDHRPRRAMFAALAAAAGRPEPTWELPAGPLHGKRVRNDRLKQLLGVTLRHPEHDLASA